MSVITAIPRRVLLTALACGLIAGGCAYFNTLYNAKQQYRDAENQPLDRDGNVSRSAEAAYDEVIAKCHKMIRTWPDSRHVDDARLLIVRSYFGQMRYEKAVAAADTLIDLHPDTDLVKEVLALKGVALARAEQHEDAVEVLTRRVEEYGATPQVLLSLCTSLMSIDDSEGAVHYLGVLENKYPNESETFNARIALAEILADKGQLEQSRDVYLRLTSDRIPEEFRYRIWMGFAAVDLQLERYDDALDAIARVKELPLTPEEEPPALLRQASAQMGADSIDAAVATYEDVAGRFSRGEFAAEAHYHLGEIYEEMDSLETARKHYADVSKAYANSDFSPEALRRANNLSQLQKLQEAADDDSPEAMALRTFSMAELQLLQFENTDKALAGYQKLLAEYPDTELAPKAAYAVGYIYAVLLGDSTRALDSYRLLMSRYPESQQAQYASRFITAVGGVPVGFTLPERVETAPPPAAAREPADTVATTPARADVAPDTTGPGTRTRRE